MLLTSLFPLYLLVEGLGAGVVAAALTDRLVMPSAARFCTAAPLFCPLRPRSRGDSWPLCPIDLQPDTKREGACLHPIGALVQHDVHKRMYVPLFINQKGAVWCGKYENSNPASTLRGSENWTRSGDRGNRINPGLRCRTTCVYKGPMLLFSGKLYTRSHILTATRGRLTSYLTSTVEWKNWAWRSL